MIGFLHPWALAGLVAAAIPILLHLLARREPPTVVFPAVRYLITTTQRASAPAQAAAPAAAAPPHAAPRGPRARGGRPDAPAAAAWPVTRRARWCSCVDNSPSSGVVVGRDRPAGAAPGGGARGAAPGDAGRRALAARGRRRARGAATGRPCSTRSARSSVSPRRLDLGGGARPSRGDVLAGEPRPGRDRAADRSPGERGLAGRASACRWSSAGRTSRRRPTSASPGWRPGRSRGAPTAAGSPSSLAGDSGGGTPVTRAARRAAARVRRWPTSGGAAVLAMPGVPSGWWNADGGARSGRAPAGRPAGRRGPGGAGRPGGLGLGQPVRRRRLRGAGGQPPDRARHRGDARTAGPRQLGRAAARGPGGARRAQPRARGARRGVALRGARRSSPARPTAARWSGGSACCAATSSSRRRAGAPGCWPRWAARRGWCGAATWCCSEAGSIRRGPTCPCLGRLHAVHGRAAEPAGPGRGGARGRRAGRRRCRCRTSSPRCARASATGGSKAAACSARRIRAPTTCWRAATPSARSPRTSIRASRCWRPATDAQARAALEGRAGGVPRRGRRRRVRRAPRGATCAGRCSGPRCVLGLAEVVLASVWRRQPR